MRRIIWNIRCSDIDFSQYSLATRAIVAGLVWLSRLPWAVATNSRAGQRVHAGLGYRPRRWIYLPNGLDTSEWRPNLEDRAKVRRELGFSESDIVVGMVARVDPQKDHAGFLAAVRMLVAKHPRLRVLLVGQGTRTLPLPEELRPVTAALGQRSDVPRLMRARSIFSSPRRPTGRG